MPTLEFQMTVNAPLEAVWALHDDPARNLPALSPPQMQVRIESVDAPLRQGSRIVIHGAGLAGRPIRWVAHIVEHRPPHPVVFGQEARFVDEQEQGPFAYWRHAHEFEALDSKTTRIVDRLTYRLPLGPLGWLADILLVRRRVVRMFAYRQDALRRIFAE